MDPYDTDALSDGTAAAPAEPATGTTAIEHGLIDLSAIQVIPDDPYKLDLTIEQLENHEDIRIDGRRLAALTDAELAALEAETSTPEPAGGILPVADTAMSLLTLSRLRVVWPQKPVPVRMYVDEGVLAWFTRFGPDYGPVMNAVLRAYVDAQLNVKAGAR